LSASRGSEPDSRWRREAYSPPPDLTIDEWAERSVILPRSVAAEAGPISIERTPYLREILHAARDPDVEEITLMFSTQVAKTTFGIILALYHLAEDPWPVLWVAPKSDDAVSINTDRFQRIINESPDLQRHLSGAAHEMTRDAIRFPGAVLWFASANSPSDLASRSIAILILDEMDKFQQFAGREASPIDLARERTRTYGNRKIIKTSTPTTQHGLIYQEYLKSDRRRYHVPCLHCGHYQVLVMGGRDPGAPGIHWPVEERDPEKVLTHRLAWYECGGCHGRITDMQRPEMLRRGLWVPHGCAVGPGGKLEGEHPPRRLLGYHLNALYSPWLDWSRIAAEFLRSKDYPASLMNFRNSWLAEIWEDKASELKVDHVRARVGPWETGTVPVGARALTAGVDVQQDCLWYVVRAWGPHCESWLVRAGLLQGFAQLEGVLFKTNFTITGTQNPVPMTTVFIDSGYAERQAEVYDYCRRPWANPVKGDGALLQPWSVSKFARHDGTEGKLHRLSVGYFKDLLHSRIRVRPGDPGEWHLPRDLDESYFQHMVSEQKVRVTDKRTGKVSMIWKSIPDGAPNHLFDCEVYALAAAVISGYAEIWNEGPAVAQGIPGAPAKPQFIPKQQQFKRRFTRLNSRTFRGG
jgi:phage terminase large subunit GpA-like protein